MAKDAEVRSGTSSTPRSAKNSPSDMAKDAEGGGNNNGGNDETIERSPLSKKPNGLTGYLTFICFKKKWVSLDSFGYSWGFQLEALSKWLRAKFAGLLAQGYKERSSCWATQGSHPNQSLRKSTLHRYNKLSSRQVRGTYELSWYHSTSIIKLRLLGTSTPFSGTSFSSLTSPHKCSSGNTQLYDVYLIGSLAAKRTPSHSGVGFAIRFEPSQPTNTSTKPEDLPGLRPEDLPVLRYWGVTLLRLSMFLKSLEQSLKTANQKEKRYNLSLVVDRLTMTATALN